MIPDIGTVIEVELGTSNMSTNMYNDVQKFGCVVVCSDDMDLIKDLYTKNRSEKIFFMPVQDVISFIGSKKA